MKLLIVLSVIACGYAAKLDRTYLPPASAGTSGGSPGSLNTPLGPSGFGQPAGFGQPGNSGFNSAAGKPSVFGSQSGNNGFGAPSNQYGQPGPSGSQSGQNMGPNFDAGFSAPAQNFGNQAQDYQRNQPQRAQASAEQGAQILRSDSQNNGDSFSYSFETSNGISAEESGVAANGVQAQGAFSYSNDNGEKISVQYTADENGYQPQGDHLPTSPPIPDEILKSIEENARAAASGTQEGAYNPNEDNNEVSPQQYNSNAPNSYNQAPNGQNGFGQSGKNPAQLYGSPNAGISRPQSGAQSFSQGPSQLYNAGSGAQSAVGSGNAGPARPSNGFGQSQVSQSPSQLYGAARPNSFGQQGPSQQYSAGPAAANGNSGGRPSSFGQQYSAGSPGSNFASSGPQANLQYQASSSSQLPSGGRPLGPAQSQDASGYQYNKPQSGFGGNGNNGPSQQYQPQNGAPSGNQGYSRPNGAPIRPNVQGSFGPSSGSQGSFGASPSPQGSFGSSSGSQGSFGSNSGSQENFAANPNSQGSYGSTPAFNSQSSSAPSGSNSVSGPYGSSGPKGPAFGSSSPSFGSSARPNSAFGPASSSQPSFGSSSSGFTRPQGSNVQVRPQGQASSGQSPMSDAGYEYNRPSGNAQFGSYPQKGNAPFGQPQNGFQSADQGRPGQFGAPRAPPSFSEEEGYKY